MHQDPLSGIPNGVVIRIGRQNGCGEFKHILIPFALVGFLHNVLPCIDCIIVSSQWFIGQLYPGIMHDL